uniref:Protein Star n=1 Tax=Cacopsylla melanoneura TaxID=428564 RepID=A0A8D8RJD1_9HEMI
MMSFGKRLHIRILLLCLLLIFLAILRFYLYKDEASNSSIMYSDPEFILVNKLYTYSEDDLKINGEKYPMNDPRLVNKLKTKFLLPPSREALNLESTDVDPSMGQATQVRRALKDMKNGFFIECGALDGETRSNTLFMERYLDWSGLLIEADPLNFYDMLKKHRKAQMSPSCLSVHPYATVVRFEQNKNMGKIREPDESEDLSKRYVDVQCFPLVTYLLAMNITTVDYFSLDVEGSELQVLQTIPFDQFNIRTLSVEWTHVKEGKDEIRSFMEKKGYTVFSEVTNDQLLANDFIFVKDLDS